MVEINRSGGAIRLIFERWQMPVDAEQARADGQTVSPDCTPVDETGTSFLRRLLSAWIGASIGTRRRLI